MTVRSITQVHIILIIALASCTTTSLFYVNLFKERFSLMPHKRCLSFSGCKGMTFFSTHQMFSEIF